MAAREAANASSSLVQGFRRADMLEAQDSDHAPMTADRGIQHGDDAERSQMGR